MRLRPAGRAELMQHAWRVVRLAVVALALIAPACNKTSTTASTTTPTVARTTDTFSGVVQVHAADFHNFTVTATGQVDVTLTTTTPAVVMGISIGTPSVDGKCGALSGATASAAAGASVQLSGLVSAATLCVDVHDIGNQTAPVSYTVTVTHP
jgi:hypothetical protein